MTIFQSVLFGIVEGLTEFIPVSSTGHMLVLQRLLGLPSTAPMFAYIVMIQLGAIAALLAFFWTDFWNLFRAFWQIPFASESNRQAWFILVATLPALAAGLLLKTIVQRLFAVPLMEAAIRFLTAAVILMVAESLGRRNRHLASMTWLDALLIGLFQVLAVFPGASRSGAAIGGGMLRDLDRPSATRFAFLMSAPIMLAAGAYEAVGVIKGASLGGLLPALLVGALVAAVVGWLSIRWFIRYVSGHRLYTFAVYCAILGLSCAMLSRF
jgi:undecaprenyl-diphosphatase